MLRRLVSGKERKPDGGNLGIGRSDFGDRTCSSQLQPQILATSSGSHLTTGILAAMSLKFEHWCLI